MASDIPRQGAFFYQANWTPEIDTVMLQTILHSKRDAKWEGTVIPIPFLVEAAKTIASEVGITFTWSELYERFQLFEKRYRAFKEVVDAHGAFLNVHTNTVSAPEPVWNAIFAKNSFCGAYYYEGEREFNNLSMLFGTTQVEIKKNDTVIVISDTSLPKCQNEGSESVYSPIFDTSTKLRRRLFDEGMSGGSESTNEQPPFKSLPDDRELQQRVGLPFPPPPSKKNMLPSSSPNGSSCASTNRNKWWRNIQK
ncbi:hypothetical protein AAHA92_24865 [Salvia divinorum]|uniref:Myb/SANT-like domain-containing protein n=1 Tax=Salvia divinorum TaxID=28513 RepID=A0ABD1G8W5_SALDI